MRRFAVIAFVLLYALMAKWALPQVARVIENRQKRIADDIAQAGRLKEQSDAAVAAEFPDLKAFPVGEVRDLEG